MLKGVVEFCKDLLKEESIVYYGLNETGKIEKTNDFDKAIYYHDLETDTIHKVNRK